MKIVRESELLILGHIIANQEPENSLGCNTFSVCMFVFST